MSDSIYLVARVLSSTLNEDDLSWVATQKEPYEKINPIDITDEEYNQVYQLYKISYAYLKDPLLIKNKYQLVKYNRWILITDSKGIIIGFILGKTTSFGIKICLTGSDGSRKAKKSLKQFHRKVYNIAGVFAEVSGKMEQVVNNYAPLVPNDVAENILSQKTITKTGDGYHYKRKIFSSSPQIEKVIVGKPRIKK